MNKENIHNLMGAGSWELLKRLKLEVSGKENIEKTNELLRNGKKILLIHNHPGTPDPAFIIRFVSEVLTDAKAVGYFASSKFYDGRMPFFGWTISYLKKHGILNADFPVIQQNDKRSKLTPEEINGKNARSIYKGFKFLKDTISSVLCIAPEGTRSPDTIMHQPIDTVGQFFRLAGSDVMLLPVSIEGSQNIHYKGKKFLPNPFAKTKLHVGEPLSYGELTESAAKWGVPIEQAMMITLGMELPVEYWGKYSNKLIEIV